MDTKHFIIISILATTVYLILASYNLSYDQATIELDFWERVVQDTRLDNMTADVEAHTDQNEVYARGYYRNETVRIWYNITILPEPELILEIDCWEMIGGEWLVGDPNKYITGGD